MHALILLLGAAISVNPSQPGNYVVNMRVDGARREYRLHLPPNYDGRTPLPVILAFHGMSANGRQMQRWTRLDQTADDYGFITVYPSGTGVSVFRGFKAGASTTSFSERKPDDVLFIHAILDDLEQTVCMDSCRVYATGLSNGAMMCYRLAVEMPDRIAAIAPVSGALGTDVCPPVCSMPILHFHGTCDQVVPISGPQEQGLFSILTYYPVLQTIQMFASASGCSSEPYVSEVIDNVEDGTAVRIHTYPDCENDIEVTFVEIIGGGHQWPQRPLPFRYLGNATYEVDANEMICSFFLRHTLCGAEEVSED